MIAQDSATERFNKDLKLVTAIHNCTRGPAENPTTFVNQLN